MSLGTLLRTAWRYWSILVWCVWWGGLTFYAVIVVPLGTEVLGSVDQGFVTQRVTHWHNGLSCFWIATLVFAAIQRPSRGLWTITILQSIVLALLFVQHARLTALMNFDSRTVPEGFYAMHARYLWLVAFQWSTGLIIPFWIWNDRPPVA